MSQYSLYHSELVQTDTKNEQTGEEEKKESEGRKGDGATKTLAMAIEGPLRPLIPLQNHNKERER